MNNNKQLIIFICTGNTCRSPMAEALFKNGLTADELEKIEVKSYGISTFGGDSAAENAIKAMKNQGIDISAHRSTPLNQYAVDNADLIVCMSRSHKAILSDLKVNDNRVIVLDISDPYGCDLKTYIDCAENIKQRLSAVYDRIRK